MDQRLLFALIGALPGLVPAVLMYMQRKKEIIANMPLGYLTAATTAEVALRKDLISQLDSLKKEIKELKAENRELRNRIIELEKLNLGVKSAWESADISSASTRKQEDENNVEVRKNFIPKKKDN